MWVIDIQAKRLILRGAVLVIECLLELCFMRFLFCAWYYQNSNAANKVRSTQMQYSGGNTVHLKKSLFIS